MNHHKLTPGTSQTARLIRALSPDSFQLDDRSWQDFITTAHRYAAWLSFYDEYNVHFGDWAGFWEQETLTYLAVLAALDTDQLRRSYEEVEIELVEKMAAYLDPDDDTCMEDPWPACILQLIKQIRVIAVRTEQIYSKLKSLEHPLASILLSLIEKENKCDFTELQGALQKLVTYHKAAYSMQDGDPVLPDCNYELFYLTETGKSDTQRWGIVGLSQYHGIPASGELASREQLREIFKSFHQTLVVLKSRAQHDFNLELAQLEKPESEDFRIVQPHIALFITFLNLFRYVQDDMNELPAKHLRYYYEDILGITRRPSAPDHAYLIFTLAKGVFDEFIEKGTLLLGGTDKSGKPIYYETIEDWRLTQAKVEEVLNTYIGEDFIKAAKVIDQGKPVSKEPFRLFGDSPENPPGELGFAIASPQLLLLEGDRNINIKIDLSGEIRNANSFDQGSFKIKYSADTEDGFNVLNSAQATGTLNQGPNFVVSPQVVPFLPLQTVEPARRIACDIVSDLCKEITTTSTNIPYLADIKSIFSRGFGTENNFLISQLYYPALSGVYYTSLFIIREEEKLAKLTGNDPSVNAERKAIQLALVELYFYRAYYHWSLLTVFAPSTIPILDRSAIIEIELNKPPSLTNFTENELYSVIVNDLYSTEEEDLNAFHYLKASGKTSNPRDKTTINESTIYALLARVFFQQGRFAECLEACEKIIDYSYDKVENSSDLKSPSTPFNNVKTSNEVIWAIETAASGVNSSLFSYLGKNDSFGRPSEWAFWPFSEGLKTTFKKSETVIDQEDTVDASTTFEDLRLNNLTTGIPSSSLTDYYSTKYFRNNNTSVVMIRYAEIQLMQAICITKTSTEENDLRTVIRSINQLRNRAKVKLYSLPEPGINLTALTVEQIIEESCRELAFEGLRLNWIRALGSDNIFIENSRIIIAPVGFFSRTSGILPNEINLGTIDSVIELNISLKQDAPAFMPNKQLAAMQVTAFPIIYITFSGTDKSDATISDFYNFLIKQKVENITVTTTVKGIKKSLILQNDFGKYDGTQRFYPFGPVPENGAQFYLGCEEAFYKKLNTAKLTFNWIEDKNPDLRSIYGSNTTTSYPGYPDFPFAPEVKIDILNAGIFTDVKTSMAFDENYVMTKSILLDELLDKRSNTYNRLEKYEPTLIRGFARMTLKGDFGHKVYPIIQTAAVINAAKEKLINGNPIPPGTPVTNILPKPPYTPSTNSISLDYTSEQEMEWESVENGIKTGVDQFFHVLPHAGFKQYTFGEQSKGVKPALVYDFDLPPDIESASETNTASALIAGGTFFPACLYIGLSKLDPSGAVSLLFQVAEGSELSPDDETPDIYWSYLRAQNDWEPFRPEYILSDSTLGLTKSGIIRFAIPADISSDGNTMLNPALLWIRASLKETDKIAGALSSFTAINAQAMEVQFTDRNNEQSHLARPVPEGTISKLAFSRSVVKSIEQPLPTFDGRLPEDIGTEYFRRVSERLRHKDRAVVPADYERILLEKYGALLTVKAIPHTIYEKRQEILSPGCVTLAVIPVLRLSPKERRVSPRIPKGELLKMEQFLRGDSNALPNTSQYLRGVTNLHLRKTDPIKRLQVVNPLYDRVLVKAMIEFEVGDYNLFKTRTIEALNHFIAPWIENTGQLPSFGRCLYRSQFVALLENLPFVKFVKNLDIFVERLEEGMSMPDNGYVIKPTTARSILTSGINHVIIPPDTTGSTPNLDKSTTIPPVVTGPATTQLVRISASSYVPLPTAVTTPQQAVAAFEVEDPEIIGTQSVQLGVPANTLLPQHDLTIIEGIGPKVAALLIEAGIETWDKLAKATQKKLNSILKKGGSAFSMHDPATWPEQAKLAAAGKMDELEQLKIQLNGGKR